MAGMGPAAVLAVMIGALGATPDPERDEKLRDPQHLVFEEVLAFDVADLKGALSADIDVQAAGDTRRPLAEYLKALEESVAEGYRHAGFEKPKVTATHDVARSRIVITVDEGMRFRCGKVLIKGLDDPALVKGLERALTEEWPGLDSIPIAVHMSDGTERTTYQDAKGNTKRLLGPVWQAEKPVAFDDHSQDARDERIRHFFDSEGRPITIVGSWVETDTATGEGTLVIMVFEPAPKVVLKDVQVVGEDADSRGAILKFLAIGPESEYNARLGSEWERRLWESGRFLFTQIPPPLTAEFVDEEIKRIKPVLKIMVVRHPWVPPLQAALSPAEEALLKFRSWLYRWAAGETDKDLVCDVELDVAASKIPTIRGKLVISPTQGEALSLKIGATETYRGFEQVFVASAGEVLMHSPARGAHLRITEPPPMSITAKLSLTARAPTVAAPHGEQYFVGFEWKTRKESELPINLDLQIDPAAVLAWVHRSKLTAKEQEGGSILLTGPAGRLVIDVASGELIEFHLEYGNEARIDIRPVKGAFQREAAERRADLARSRNVFDRQRPISSVLGYLVNEWEIAGREVTAEQAVRAAALRKLLERWSPEPIENLFGATTEHTPRDQFIVPPKREERPENKETSKDGRAWRNSAGHFLALYRKLVPADGDLWPLGREVGLALINGAGDSAKKAATGPQFPDAGPIAHLIAARILSQAHSESGRALAREGAELLQPDKFSAADLKLLGAESWLGRNLISLLTVLRGLEENEIRSLTEFIPEGLPRETALQIVLEARRDRSRPLPDGLPSILNRVWQSSLSQAVETALNDLGRERPTPRKIKDGALQPASGTKP